MIFDEKIIALKNGESCILISTNASDSLYKKFGFKIYGTRENGFKFKDGTYCDEHLMLKNIKSRIYEA